ncbi:Co2+/Mg2+ efflux protein ApaG [Sandarakinorhabdus rubra]|uniref:Co2+/Mg2+ efflux protein ApaG n=1 Tax=Sandarakinorhabdus rubra TaxID=2672568 RepID=UPI0013DA4DCB|nr:Co2+/Mg2+ efflux protein ApaG [Sandarakinorhabdus rubra]
MSVIGQIFPFAATTGAITVRVAPHYLPEQSDPDRGYHVWSYHVRVENAGAAAVRLMARRWLITDGEGRIEEVVGDGVVGVQPLIAPGGAYDYVSGCPLGTASGRMEGRYVMMAEDGSRFHVAIPAFPLDLPGRRPPVH